MPSPRTLLMWALFLAMEVLAFYSLVITLFPTRTVWLLLFGATSGLVAASLLARFGPGEPRNRVFLVAAGVATSAIALAPGGTVSGVGLVAIAVLVMYSRGVTVAADRVGYDEISARFGFGYGLLFLGLFLALARGELYQRSTWQGLAVLGIAYTLIAAVALGVARLETVRTPAAGRAAVAALGVQTVVLLLLALAALQFFALDLAGAAWHLTRPMFDFVGAALFNFFLLFKDPLQHLIDLLRPHPRHTPVQPRPRVPTPRPRTHVSSGSWGRVQVFALGIVIAIGAAIVAVTFWVLWRIAPRATARRPDPGYRETRRWLRSPREIWLLVLTWLRRLLRRTSGTTRHAMQALRRRVARDYPADPIRRIYALLLRRAAAAGLPRAPAVTPVEFQGQLAARWPDAAFHFARLTDAYVRRRYGDTSFDEQAVTQLEEHWHHVRATVRVPRLAAVTAGRRPASTGPATPPPTTRPRRRLSLPEFATGQEVYYLRHSVLVALVSVILAVGIIIFLLAILAVVNHF